MIKKISKIIAILDSYKYSTLAGTLSFYFTLSIIPIMYLVTMIFLFVGHENVLDNTPFFDLKFSISSSLFFMLITIFSASRFFFHINQCGNLIYKKKNEKSSFKKNILSLLSLVIFLAFLVLLIFFLFISRKYLNGPLNNILTVVAIIISIFIALYFLNFHADNNYKKIKHYFFGVLYSLIHIILFSIGFYLYLKYFANFTFLYGYFASLIIFFIWILLIMDGIIIGIVINKEIIYNYFQ